jgi:hypothetical protein
MPDNPADSHVLSELIDDVAELLGIEEHDEEDSELLLASISGGLWAILMQDGMVWIEPLEAALDANVIYEDVMAEPLNRQVYDRVTSRLQTKVSPANTRLYRSGLERNVARGVEYLKRLMDLAKNRDSLMKNVAATAARTARTMFRRLMSPNTAYARGAATASVSAMAAAAIVIALYGTVALAAIYPIEQLKYLGRQLENMARLLDRPLALSDLDPDYAAIVVSFVAMALCSSGGRRMVTDLADSRATRGPSGRLHAVIGTDIHAAGMRLLSQLKSVGDEALENLVLEV